MSSPTEHPSRNDRLSTGLSNPALTGSEAQVEDFLRGHVLMLQRAKAKPQNGYLGPHDFVLQRGQNFTPARPPPEAGQGEPRQCYENSLMLMAMHPSRYVYCEGFAWGIIPVAHAWCLDRLSGLVVDITWEQVGFQYYGVPFTSEFAKAYTLRRGRFGIIEDWENGYPLLDMEPEEFLEEDLKPCEHEWIDARNKVILEGEVCLLCGAIRAGNAEEEENGEET
jgi:hypothetical protein